MQPDALWQRGLMFAEPVTGIDHADLILLRRLLAAEKDAGIDRLHAANLLCRLNAVRDDPGWKCHIGPAEPMVRCPWPGQEDGAAGE